MVPVECWMNLILSWSSSVPAITAPPTVALVDPDGGESLPRGQPYEIRWDAGDDIGVVMTHILFPTDGGSSFPDTVASGTLDSTYVWQVPDMSATTCRIKVVVFDA